MQNGLNLGSYYIELGIEPHCRCSYKHHGAFKISILTLCSVIFTFFAFPQHIIAQSHPILKLDKQHYVGPVDQYMLDLGKHLDTKPPIMHGGATSSNYSNSDKLNVDRHRQYDTHKSNQQNKSQWFQLSVENLNSHAKEWFIATALSQAPLIRVYKQSNDGLQEIYQQDSRSRFSDRPYPHRILIIPFSLEANEQVELFIQYKSIANYPIFPVVLDQHALTQRANIYEFGNGIVLGALLILFLFFFTQFLIKPSQSLGMYCLLVLSVALFISQLTGYGFRFLWPNHGEFGIRFSAVIGGFTYIWYFLFSSALFNLKRNNPSLHKLILFITGLGALFTAIGLFIDVSKIISVFAIFALPIPLIVAIWALKNKLPSSTFFILGSSLHCSSTYLFILTCIGVNLGAHRHIFAIAGLGQLIDICLFAGALIYQSKALREELNSHLQQRVDDAEQLAQMEKEKSQSLAKLQDYVLQLAATTHDLKQPLASIKMTLAVVSDHESKEAKTKMENTLNYTEKILRSLLDNCREEYLDTIEQLDITSVFNAIESRYEDIIKEKSIQMRFKQNQRFVNCSPIVLNRLLDNLVTNAIRHTHKGGILLSARKRQHGTLFQVWDTGSGIPEQSVKKLTQPYTQLQPNKQEGSGLGLFIVKTLSANAGYTFAIRSHQNKGSCVSIFIPFIDC